jgi:hypothetical protein
MSNMDGFELTGALHDLEMDSAKRLEGRFASVLTGHALRVTAAPN